MSRLDVVISDNIRLRCGHRGEVLAVYDLMPAARGRVRMAMIASCVRCGGAWEWGEVCADRHRQEKINVR